MNHLRPFAPLLIAMLTGCQLLTSTPAGESRTSSPARVTTPAIGQAVDPDTGQAYYVVCDPCLKPTPKTRMPPPRPVVVPAVSSARPAAEPVATLPPSLPPVVAEPTPPSPAPAVAKPEPKPLMRCVPFAFGKDRLGPLGKGAMASLLAEAKSAAQVHVRGYTSRVHVRGYTDIVGNMPANKTLATSRAEEIKAFLVKGGVDPARITTSHCVDCFVDSNETVSGREANRQALVVMSTAGTPPDSMALDQERRMACVPDTKGHAAVSTASRPQ